MTEQEWLEAPSRAEPVTIFGDAVNAMLEVIRGNASGRKLRLFACACSRKVWDLPFNERQSWTSSSSSGKGRSYRVAEEQIVRNKQAVETAELFADGRASAEMLSRSFERCEPGTIGRACTKKWAKSVAGETAFLCRQATQKSAAFESVALAIRQEEIAQVDLLRCIFGNPFRPVSLEPRWLTSTVADLANAIYNDRAFDRMPILADALMDAGCDSEAILAHCRQPGEHVRGCWAVDLLLQKS